MQNIEIFNIELLEQVEPTFNISTQEILDAYKTTFPESEIEQLNIIFVNQEYIQELNKKFRDINAPTDVLSFNISQTPLEAEIYISPEYVYNTYQEEQFEEEIIRLIVHGTLHILGHEHESSLNDDPEEEMFKIQEDLVKKFKSKCF
jgi:probable rRNA maturation factor